MDGVQKDLTKRKHSRIGNRSKKTGAGGECSIFVTRKDDRLIIYTKYLKMTSRMFKLLSCVLVNIQQLKVPALNKHDVMDVLAHSPPVRLRSANCELQTASTDDDHDEQDIEVDDESAIDEVSSMSSSCVIKFSKAKSVRVLINTNYLLASKLFFYTLSRPTGWIAG